MRPFFWRILELFRDFTGYLLDDFPNFLGDITWQVNVRFILQILLSI